MFQRPARDCTNGQRGARRGQKVEGSNCKKRRGIRLSRVCKLSFSVLIGGLGRSVAFLVSSPLRKHSSSKETETSSVTSGQTEHLNGEISQTENINGEIKQLLQDVQFLSPLLEYGYRPAVEEYENNTLMEKPLLIYLPGFDGTFLSPFLQFPELGTVFDVRCMTVSMGDRSTFQELKNLVLDYIISELGAPRTTQQKQQDPIEVDQTVSWGKGNILSSIFGGRQPDTLTTPRRSQRPVYLAGESFGGILASEVTLSLLQEYTDVNLKGLTLVNAATCYDRSRLAAMGPTIAEYHPMLFPLGLMQLVPLFTDEHSLKQLMLILTAKALPSVIDNEEREAYLGRVALSLPFVLPVMTQDALKWRLKEWLDHGCARMARRLPQFSRHRYLRVLIVAGECDAALPSIAEAERLASILPNALVHVVEGAGHASTCGSRADLAALFRKCFPELCIRKVSGPLWKIKFVSDGRREMKAVAADGKDEYFGMEPRYDNSTIGLNPLLYWSSKYYRKVRPRSETKVSVVDREESRREEVNAIANATKVAR